jgi:hypothetical protein
VRFFVPSQQNEEYEDEIDKTEPVDNEYEDEDEYGLDQKPSQMVDPTNTTLFFKSLPEELLDYKMFQRWIRSAGVEPDKINLNSNAYFAHVRFKTHVNILSLFSFVFHSIIFVPLELHLFVLFTLTHKQFIWKSSNFLSTAVLNV